MANIEKYNDSGVTWIFQSSENYENSIFSSFSPDQNSIELKALIEYFAAHHQKSL